MTTPSDVIRRRLDEARERGMTTADYALAAREDLRSANAAATADDRIGKVLSALDHLIRAVKRLADAQDRAQPAAGPGIAFVHLPNGLVAYHMSNGDTVIVEHSERGGGRPVVALSVAAMAELTRSWQATRKAAG